MEIKPDDCNRKTTYRLISSIVAPRPIGWISSCNKKGEDNLAPYSNYNKVASNPPVVMFSAGKNRETLSDGTVVKQMKTTPKNVLETGEFVVNLVTGPFLEAVDKTSTTLDSENKFDYADVDRMPAETVTPSRVSGAKACLECTLYDTHRVHDYTMVLGSVQHIFVDDAIVTDGEIDMRKIDAVGRLGGPYYTGVNQLDLLAFRSPMLSKFVKD